MTNIYDIMYHQKYDVTENVVTSTLLDVAKTEIAEGSMSETYRIDKNGLNNNKNEIWLRAFLINGNLNKRNWAVDLTGS